MNNENCTACRLKDVRLGEAQRFIREHGLEEEYVEWVCSNEYCKLG